MRIGESQQVMRKVARQVTMRRRVFGCRRRRRKVWEMEAGIQVRRIRKIGQQLLDTPSSHGVQEQGAAIRKRWAKRRCPKQHVAKRSRKCMRDCSGSVAEVRPTKREMAT